MCVCGTARARRMAPRAHFAKRWVTRLGDGVYAPHTDSDTLVCRHTLKPHAHTQPESARTHNSQLRTYTDTVYVICISSFEAHSLAHHLRFYGTRPEWAAEGINSHHVSRIFLIGIGFSRSNWLTRSRAA